MNRPYSPSAGAETTGSEPWIGAADLSRRGFLGHLSALTASTFSGVAADSRPEGYAGTQLYGWGQYYEREGKNLWDRIDDALGLVRDCGFKYAEGSLDVGNLEANAQFAAKLRARGLSPLSLYTGGRFHETATWERHVERTLTAAKAARQAGFTILVCNPDPIGRTKTDEELRTQASALKSLGKGLAADGMRLGIHHHTPEMAGQAREFHSNFQKTEAGVVDFCYDVHWVYRGGVQPKEALEQYGNRIVSWHLRQSRDQIWWEDLATGDIDYAEIARWAAARGTPRNYTVELALEKGTKITRSVVENHRRSREFVRTVFGV